MVAQDHPQIVIGTWSWDGREALADPAGYRVLLEQFLATVLSPGDGVALMVLLQFPQTGPNIFLPSAAASQSDWRRQTEQEAAWDRIAHQVVGSFPGRAVFLPTEQLFAPGGRFHVWLRAGDGRWVRARMVDSVHLCPYGAALFGALVADDLTPGAQAVRHGTPMGVRGLDQGPPLRRAPGLMPGRPAASRLPRVRPPPGRGLTATGSSRSPGWGRRSSLADTAAAAVPPPYPRR